MGRAPCCDKANVKKGPWSPEEDATLKAYIDKFGTGGNWIALPQKIGLKRCGKSCRLRWLNYLRPNIKHGGFTEEEDNIICSLYISIGSRWSIIAAQLPGRTDNDIKNYWNTRLKKKLLGRRKQSNTNRVSISGHQEPKDACIIGEENSYSNLQNLSSSALERLQLHMQLQNPFSFYNNPAFWPKMIETLNSLNETQNILMQQNFTTPQFCPPGQDYGASKTDDQLVDHSIPCFPLNNVNTNISSESEIMVGKNGVEQANSDFNQLDDLLKNNNSSGVITTGNDDQIGEFDCFKDEMDGSIKGNLGWWCNEFDVKSTSSNSWDSNMIHQSEEMYQDYEIGYSMQ
ncbi:hypothetical protein DH2020_039203 [Rehmannia glutinosa]|uniref:R2R3-MYB protein n=1 Tax=Rehmannia glutinosa TaxID=99300 RepID=A0ABR0UY46_REHGL